MLLALLATATGEVIQAADAGAEFAGALDDGIWVPDKLAFRPKMSARFEHPHGKDHEQSPIAAVAFRYSLTASVRSFVVPSSFGHGEHSMVYIFSGRPLRTGNRSSRRERR